MAAVSSSIPRLLYNRLSSPFEALTVGGWSLFFAWEVSELISATKELKALNTDIEIEAEKTEKVWQARKFFFTAFASALSTSMMGIEWMDTAKLISLGAFAPFALVVKYAGWTAASLSQLWELLREFKGNIEGCDQSKDALEKEKVIQTQAHKLLKIAFQASFATWGILGLVTTFSGTLAFVGIIEALSLMGLVFLMGDVLYTVYLQQNPFPQTQLASTSLN